MTGAQVKFGDKRTLDFYTNINISTASSVKLYARSIRNLSPRVLLVHTVVDAPTGHIAHKTDGTLAVGAYLAEIEVEFGGGTTRVTFPSDAALEEFEITPRL